MSDLQRVVLIFDLSLTDYKRLLGLTELNQLC